MKFLECNSSFFITCGICYYKKIFYNLCKWSFNCSSCLWYSYITWQQVIDQIKIYFIYFKCCFSRLRRCPRNILHVNVFLVFLLRSAVQLFSELFMSRGYFDHNIFYRTNPCNRTTAYFKEDQVKKNCLLFNLSPIFSYSFSYSIVNYLLSY